VRRELPSGTVSFLFTDVEGSTRLLHELGADDYAEALAGHRRVLREAFSAHGGVEVDTQGDAFFVAFPTAPGALRAAAEALEGLAAGQIRVRMGLHTGTPHLGEEGYVGVDVHRAARIAACGHGGQVLVSQSTRALVDPSNSLLLVDLGEHRLKDLSAPERIYQLGEGEFPPLKSLYRTNLPIPATPFLGREKELLEVLELLSREDVRLLTLTGPGGTGKTRLALQAAGGLADRYPHGVWWVPLALLRDPELVLEAAGQALGAKDGLAEHIADRSMLLLFDNFEQVVEAAAALAALLASCPNLDLLVTSREPLHVTGEQEYPVPPLVHEEGVGFFLARARAVKPDFGADDTVSEICRRLDELPLALELAAARVKALSSGQLLVRLEQRLPLLTGGARDLPERQRTLRATIEWSHDLLSPEEQRLFARLAVFLGGSTLEAAEEVAEADLDTLQSLVDKSLVRHTGERYWMLETIREYATERLEESGEAEELHSRHVEHFLALAEEAEPEIKRGSPKHWVDRLAEEHDNLRATLDRLAAAGETQAVLQMAGALWPFWQFRGHFAEGRARLERALAVDEQPTAARARALAGAAMLELNAEEPATVRRRGEEALRISDELGDAWGTAYALNVLGGVATAERDWERALALWEQSLQAFRELGDDHYVLALTRSVAWMREELGDLEGYRALVEDYLRQARLLGNERLQARGLGALAMIAVDEGRLDDAVELMKESYRIDRELGFTMFVAIDLVRFAAILVRRDRAARAAQAVSLADRLFEEIDAAHESWAQRERDETVALIRAQLDEASFAAAYDQGRTLEADEGVALALDALD